MAEEFLTEVTPEKPYLMEVEQAKDQQVDVTDAEQAADPSRSPTALKKPRGERAKSFCVRENNGKASCQSPFGCCACSRRQ